ncbi:hypothetical protein [Leptospira stimsonii]|uniref:Uncharacterized protein n=1 Tax=Leptospira stimsonii TaxID=2202203 RepID=A0A8B3CTR6_9LEPT|nr:hypothetical protein [Leptospira stimsonii]RHX88651.1 hypothetical protein DLM78_06940 [Leptospira stimsonii]
MGKTLSIPLGKEKNRLRFLLSFLFLLLSHSSRAETPSKEGSPRDLNPFLFSERSNSSFALGFWTEAKKETLPSYGFKLSLPVLPENPRHLWKWNLLSEKERNPEQENRWFYRTFSGLEYSYLPPENRFRLSFFAGWERGEIDLFVFGTRLEFFEKQGIQVFGKRGGDFESVSILLHSPREKEFTLFLGASRSWNGAQTEDRFSLGVVFSWENLQFSAFGNETEGKQHSVSSIFEFRNITSQREAHPKKETVFKNVQNRNQYHSLFKISLGVQELLSAGFSLDSSLRISRESSRSREAFFEFVESLSEKDKNRVLAILRKKNPSKKKEKR